MKKLPPTTLIHFRKLLSVTLWMSKYLRNYLFKRDPWTYLFTSIFYLPSLSSIFLKYCNAILFFLLPLFLYDNWVTWTMTSKLTKYQIKLKLLIYILFNNKEIFLFQFKTTNKNVWHEFWKLNVHVIF